MRALVKHLPPDGAFAATQTAGWTDAQELRASLVEITHALFRATLSAHGAKRVPKQIKIPRPHHEAARRDPTTDEVMAFFTGKRR